MAQAEDYVDRRSQRMLATLDANGLTDFDARGHGDEVTATRRSIARRSSPINPDALFKPMIDSTSAPA